MGTKPYLPLIDLYIFLKLEDIDITLEVYGIF